jgi:two-component system, cell cycle response regulator
LSTVGSSDKHQAFKTIPLDDRSLLGDKVLETLKAPFRPALVIIRGQHMGTVRKLDRTITVGRDPDAELVLTDAGVSWHHARVEDRGDSWVVIDLDSTNGTFVNASRTPECILQPGDRIAFGPVLARFEVQDALDQAYDDFVEQMLNVDDLSGLYVRRKFETELDAMIVAARASGGSAGLLVMDLDGIKGINDTHGHLFGAYVIGEAGHVIGRVIEGNGVGTRFGGDEFCAALPGCDTVQTVDMGEKILAAIHDHPFLKDGIALHPGISIGAASFPACAADRLQLFQCADEALYRAKHGGKNRVCT